MKLGTLIDAADKEYVQGHCKWIEMILGSGHVFCERVVLILVPDIDARTTVATSLSSPACHECSVVISKVTEPYVQSAQGVASGLDDRHAGKGSVTAGIESRADCCIGMARVDVDVDAALPLLTATIVRVMCYMKGDVHIHTEI